MSDAADGGGGVSGEAPAPAAPAESVPVEVAPIPTPAPEVVAEPVPAAPEVEIEAAPEKPEPSVASQPANPAPEPAPQPAAVSSAATSVQDTSIRSRLGQALEAIRFRKRARLDKILVLAAKKKSIKNDDVEKLLRVSDSTAQRYLNQLVLERKLRRSGTTAGIIYERV